MVCCHPGHEDATSLWTPALTLDSIFSPGKFPWLGCRANLDVSTDEWRRPIIVTLFTSAHYCSGVVHLVLQDMIATRSERACVQSTPHRILVSIANQPVPVERWFRSGNASAHARSVLQQFTTHVLQLRKTGPESCLTFVKRGNV